MKRLIEWVLSKLFPVKYEEWISTDEYDEGDLISHGAEVIIAIRRGQSKSK